jgi:hypothetical protein
VKNSVDAPGTGAGGSVSPESIGPAQLQSSELGTRKSELTPRCALPAPRSDLRQPSISFISAYWDWLLGKAPDGEEPDATEYELEEPHAETLRQYCRRERNVQLGARTATMLLDQAPSRREAL